MSSQLGSAEGGKAGSIVKTVNWMQRIRGFRVLVPPHTALLSGISNDGDGNLDTETALSPYKSMNNIIIPMF